MKVILVVLLSLTSVISAFELSSNVNETYSFKIPFFGGIQKGYKHFSTETKTMMPFSVYLPPNFVKNGTKCPVVYFLNGVDLIKLNDKSFFLYSFYWRWAAKYNLVVVAPSVGPVGVHLPIKSKMGIGEGFTWYVDAAKDPWKENFRMHSYVTKELPQMIESEFKDVVKPGKKSLMGHSMGGHGALMYAFKNPGLFEAVSAFAPLWSPIDYDLPAYHAYFGDDKNTWKDWDGTYLAAQYKGPNPNLLVEQAGLDYTFKTKSALKFIETASKANVSVDVRIRRFDTHFSILPRFMGEHFKYHADRLH